MGEADEARFNADYSANFRRVRRASRYILARYQIPPSSLDHDDLSSTVWSEAAEVYAAGGCVNWGWLYTRLRDRAKNWMSQKHNPFLSVPIDACHDILTVGPVHPRMSPLRRIKAVVGRLTQRQLEITLLRLWGAPQDQVGRLLGITQQGVDKAETEIIKLSS